MQLREEAVRAHREQVVMVRRCLDSIVPKQVHLTSLARCRLRARQSNGDVGWCRRPSRRGGEPSTSSRQDSRVLWQRSSGGEQGRQRCVLRSTGLTASRAGQDRGFQLGMLTPALHIRERGAGRLSGAFCVTGGSGGFEMG